MPTIITAHIANTNANSMAFQGAFAGAMMPRPAGITEPGHVHTTHIHVGPKPQHVAPRQRGQHGEGGGDNDTVTPQHCFESSLNHRGVAGTASAANYP